MNQRTDDQASEGQNGSLPTDDEIAHLRREVGRLADAVEESATSQRKSKRSGTLLLLPFYFAFLVLAMYGFFLIFSLTQDIRMLATPFDPHHETNMERIAANLESTAQTLEKHGLTIERSDADNTD